MGRGSTGNPGARVWMLVLRQARRRLDLESRIQPQGDDSRRLARIEIRLRNRTATFYVCSTCGAVPLVTSEIANHLYAVVNVNVLENVNESWLRRAAANFEGEGVESRLARRRRNWIADVQIAE